MPKVKLDSLKKTMSLVEAGLGKGGKEASAQSQCLAFKDGYVHTFNDEIACRVPLNLGFECAIPAKHFMEVVKSLTCEEVEITLETEKNRVLLKAGRKRAGFPMNDTIIMPIDQIEWATEDQWETPDVRLQHQLGDAAACTSGNEDRFYTCCVAISSDHVTAFTEFHAYKGFANFPLPEGQKILVKGDCVRPIEGIELHSVALTDNFVHFLCEGNLEYGIRRYDDADYPDINSFFEAQSGADKFIPPTGFEDSVRTASLFAASANAGDDVTVKLSEKGKMIVSGHSDVNGFYEELIDVPYDGESMKFQTNGKVLAKFASEFAAGDVSADMIRVEQDGDFIYVTSLTGEDQ